MHFDLEGISGARDNFGQGFATLCLLGYQISVFWMRFHLFIFKFLHKCSAQGYTVMRNVVLLNLLVKFEECPELIKLLSNTEKLRD